MAIVYSTGDNDLTDAVLAQLNAGAPIDLTKPATTTPPSVTNAPAARNGASPQPCQQQTRQLKFALA